MRGGGVLSTDLQMDVEVIKHRVTLPGLSSPSPPGPDRESLCRKCGQWRGTKVPTVQTARPGTGKKHVTLLDPVTALHPGERLAPCLALDPTVRDPGYPEPLIVH